MLEFLATPENLAFSVALAQMTLPALELSEQDRAIAIATKSKEKSEAEAQADQARAEAVRAEEQVTTVRDTEIAERDKSIELVEAAKEAERQAIQVKVAAEAEKAAAEDHADAVRLAAQGSSDRVKLEAGGRAEAETMAAEAAEQRYRVDAEGRRALNEADNLLNEEQIARQIRLRLLEQLPEIIRESARPMERIEGIRVYQVGGLAGNGGSGGGAEAVGGSLSDQVVNSALRYRAQAPLVEALLKEVGLEGKSLDGLTSSLLDEGTPGVDEKEGGKAAE